MLSPRIRSPAPGMPDPAPWAAGTGLALALVLLQTVSALGQDVDGLVRADGSDRPVEAVVVRVITSSGEDVTGGFTDAEGHFRIEVPRPGEYRLRVQRIGYRDWTSDPFELREGRDKTFRVRLPPEAIGLSELRVSTRSRCATDPKTARATHRVWRDARRALEAATWAREQGILQVSFRTFRRRLDVDLQVEEVLSESTKTGFDISPFESLPAERLSETGYVHQVGSRRIYYGPDADVVLSHAFRQDHCFWIEREGAPESGWIGLAFEPTDGRDVPDIRGTLWVDEDTGELRQLAFRYVGLDLPTSDHSAGGKVEFSRLPDGPWMVRRWRLVMPRIERSRLRIGAYSRQDYRVSSYVENGGEITRAEMSGRVVLDAGRATLGGVVWDSLAASPGDGVPVSVSGTGLADTTDARGRFRIPGVPEGRFEVVARDRKLLRLGLDPPARTVQVSSGEQTDIELALPGPAGLARRLCGDGRSGPGLVVGRVVGGEGGPVPGARVAAVWQPSESTRRGDGDGGETHVHRETRADSSGTYALCGVPPERSVVLRAERGQAVSPTREVRVPTIGFARRQLRLAATDGLDDWARRIQREGGDALRQGGGKPDRVARLPDDGPPATLIGTVTAAGDGRPLPSAEVVVDDDRLAVTDEEGRFRLDSLAPGRHSVRVEYVGFDSRQATVQVPAGDTVRPTLRMETDPVPLPGVRVEMAGRGRGAQKLSGFWRRKKQRIGHFITPEEIEQTPGGELREVFRQVPTLAVTPCPGPLGVTTPDCHIVAPTRTQRGSLEGHTDCDVALYLDGIQVPAVRRADGRIVGSFLTDLPREDVAAIEVYSSAAEAPARFRGTQTGRCGVVVVWTETGRS